MFESLVETITAYPYIGVAVVFVLCGMGLPLPEEVVLIAAGFVCFEFPDRAEVPWMMATCAGAIMLGDLIPFVLGRWFGARLLRLRFMRLLVTKRRLAKFDKWFRKRGDLVIFIARFLAGIRSVAFFTAGTLKMSWLRFLFLDGLGIVILVPPFVYIGHTGGDFINSVIAKVQQLERSIVWASLAAAIVLIGFLWWKGRRRRLRRRRLRPRDSYVAPRIQPREELHGPPLPPSMLAAVTRASKPNATAVPPPTTPDDAGEPLSDPVAEPSADRSAERTPETGEPPADGSTKARGDGA